ncbi:hypothetical protein GGR88_001125 [Sphingomonas jejuensis]|uniref:Uncharacterized protein n=1 Tax=Sphingomonas jejuensis TaxID=904715 RepID=A0ABX0XLQ9_9SPHN|nr:hypothetical protein [Sphingomonas jejuensis]NJC33651.1 hypothetical protein [Sphingomonas jejuensis]
MTSTTSKTLPALLCTIVFSATCVLSAVGPAITGGSTSAAPATQLAVPTASAMLA